jgi:hypothetical protein
VTDRIAGTVDDRTHRDIFELQERQAQPKMRTLKWALTIFVVWYLIKNPTGAAHVVTSGWTTLGRGGTALGRFFTNLHL